MIERRAFLAGSAAVVGTAVLPELLPAAVPLVSKVESAVWYSLKVGMPSYKGANIARQWIDTGPAR